MSKQRKSSGTHYLHLGVFVLGVIFGVILTFGLFKSANAKQTGFDDFGYNYGARIFSGKADGVDKRLDNLLWGDATYANDRLVMKWSKAWHEARFGTSAWNCDAWTSNEWNGKVPGGSGETWHYKISWVGPQLQNSPCWREGGYSIWGEFEVIFSQGTVGNQHFWDAHAKPAGYGGF